MLPGYRVIPVDGLAIARRHGLGRIVNSALLGALARAAGGTAARGDGAHAGASSRPSCTSENIAACEEGYRQVDAQLRGVAA